MHGGCYKILFSPQVNNGRLVRHAYTMTHDTRSRDIAHHNPIILFYCQSTENDTVLVCFGHLLGTCAHHKGLRRLKPCQYRRAVYSIGTVNLINLLACSI